MFERWCGARGLDALPAAETTVWAWLTDTPRSDSTVEVYCWAVRSVHARAGFPDPTHGIDAQGLTARRRRAQAAGTPTSARVLKALPQGAGEVAVRGRALLLLSYSGGLGLAALAQLAWDQVEYRPAGLVVHTDTGPVVIARTTRASSDAARAMVDWMLFTSRGYVFPDGRGRTSPVRPVTLYRTVRRLGGRGFSRTLHRGLTDDALRAGLSDAVVRRHLDRSADIDQRFTDAIVRGVGL